MKQKWNFKSVKSGQLYMPDLGIEKIILMLKC